MFEVSCVVAELLLERKTSLFTLLRKSIVIFFSFLSDLFWLERDVLNLVNYLQ